MRSKNTWLAISLIGIIFGIVIVSKESRSDTINFATAEDLIKNCQKEDNCLEIIEAANKVKKVLKDLDLEGANLAGANLEKISFINTNLSNADLRIAYLEKAVLFNSNFTGANLDSAYLQQAYLENSNFTEANLRRAKLASANLTGANFVNSNLTQANLDTANLENANLKGADLTSALIGSYAKLQGTNFEYANLKGANFRSASLSGTILNGANLEGAIILRDRSGEYSNGTNGIAEIKSACNWQKAIYILKDNRREVDKAANQKFIEKLKQDKAYDPLEAVDCSKWQDDRN